MPKKQEQPEARTALRRAAEARLEGNPPTQPPQTEVDQRRLQHELEVHQVELEMQNEDLQVSQTDLKIAIERSLDLFDFAPVGYFDVTADGTIRLVNHAGAILLGVERARLTGRHIQEFLAASDRPAFNDFFHSVLKSKTKQVHEFRLVKADQTLLHALLEASRSSEGASGRLAILDITKRKEMEAALLASEGRYRAVVEGQTELICRYSKDGTIAFANDVFCRFFGKPAEELVGQKWQPKAVAEDLPLVEEKLRQFSPSTPVVTIENRVYSGSGQVHWMQFVNRGFFDSQGRLTEIQSVGRDITERRLAEAALRASEERHRAVLHTAMDGFWRADAQGRLLEVNETFCQMSGYSAPELLAMNIADLEASETAADTAAHMQKIKAQGEDRFESRHRRKDGSILDVEVSVQYRPDEGGCFLAFLRDISARKRSEAEREKLEASNRQLMKSESLSRMAGAIAHSFNNQLQVVIMNLEMAQHTQPPTAGGGESLSEAMQSARKAAAISTQMLTYLGQTQSQLESLDLSAACRQCLPMLRAGLPLTIALETILPAPGPLINANVSQIQEVVTQLLTNAGEASADGSGPLHLTVKQVSAAAIPAVNRRPTKWQPRHSAYACLEVADSGCGIAAGDIERIFDPFFSSKLIGRGLGLSVVLGIVREHGGAITVESGLGQGSVFRVFLPVADTAVPQEPVPVVPAPKAVGRGTVLVIEDEQALRVTVTRALERTGFTVFAAADGVEGLELFKQHRDEIQCVLCDLTMPRMGGWGTLAALRQLKPGIPVILSSGYDDAKVMEGHHPELPQAFLQKPYDLQALINTLNRLRPKAPARKSE